jgi:uncharacterized protein
MSTKRVELRDLKGRVIDAPTNLRAKIDLILAQLRSYEKVLVAFSGGVDSTLLTYLAKMALKDNVLAVTANSPSLSSSELKEAKKIARQIGVKHLIIETNELTDPNYISNPTNRCYFCKKELGEKLTLLAKNSGGYVVLDGTNAEDLKGHRPGAAALSEQGIRRPLTNAGMNKEEVRKTARLLGLPNFNKPSLPCLSSRVQYGQSITAEKLLRIERSEDLIHSLTGTKELRVRDHGNLARIEVGRNERELFFNKKLLDEISKGLQELGYTYVTLDLIGYRSGSMLQPSSSSTMHNRQKR